MDGLGFFGFGASGEEMTPEQRVATGIADARFGQAGLGSLGVGERLGTGGGGVGQFVFADLAELKSVTDQWKVERDRIQQDNDEIRGAIGLCGPPAEDVMSVYQADALKKSLTEAWKHNQTMLDYADQYVQKLEASRKAMVGTEQDNAAKLRTTGEV